MNIIHRGEETEWRKQEPGLFGWSHLGDFRRQRDEAVAMGVPHMMINCKIEPPKIPSVFFFDFTMQQGTRSVEEEAELLRGNWAH